jgi:hypothetical protein
MVFLMRDFELTFEVPTLAESLEDAIADDLDAVIASHAGVATVTALVPATDCLQAARTAIDTLRRIGAPPVRLMDDLVTRGQIADRAGVTRQAVGMWIRGERRSNNPFPDPFVLAGGGLWLWGEVAQVLTARGDLEAEGVAYPTRRESQVIGGMLAADQAVRGSWSADLLLGATTFAVTAGIRPGSRAVSAPDSARTDFALSA